MSSTMHGQTLIKFPVIFIIWRHLEVARTPSPQDCRETRGKISGSCDKRSLAMYQGVFESMPCGALPCALEWIEVASKSYCQWEGPMFLGAFAKFRKATISFVMSIRPSVPSRVTTRLPLDGFSFNFMFEHFPRISWGSSSFVKIWQEWRVLYTKTSIYFWSYHAQFFSE